MGETQNLEWKSSWRDEHLKWICGFANAQGGVLVIGKNDRGEIVGEPNPSAIKGACTNDKLLGVPGKRQS